MTGILRYGISLSLYETGFQDQMFLVTIHKKDPFPELCFGVDNSISAENIILEFITTAAGSLKMIMK